MELRVLNYFLMVAREENITRAAQRLHVTQPTLSRQLMQLEEELGTRLFKRSNHSIVLTEDGMLLKRRAQEIVSLAERTRRDFIQEGQLSGTIAIGSGELQSTRLLSEIMASFRREHPLVQFEIFSGNSDNIKERIERGSLDLGLLLEPVDIGKYAFVRVPIKEQWGILAGEGSELAAREAVRPEDLLGVPLLMARRELVQRELVNWFGEYAEQMQIAASGNLLYNLAVLTRSMRGVTVNLKLDCRYDGLRFVPLSPRLESSSVLVWKKAQPFSHTTEAFIRHARKYLDALAASSRQNPFKNAKGAAGDSFPPSAKIANFAE